LTSRPIYHANVQSPWVQGLWLWLASALCVGVGVGACAGDDAAQMQCPPPEERDGSTPLPEEIEEIVERRCWECHDDPPNPAKYAPFALTTWEQVQTPRAGREELPIYEVIAERIDDPVFSMPPPRSPQLDDNERATLHAWIEQCAPAAP
jgi:uncharacterized membrane protein